MTSHFKTKSHTIVLVLSESVLTILNYVKNEILKKSVSLWLRGSRAAQIYLKLDQNSCFGLNINSKQEIVTSSTTNSVLIFLVKVPFSHGLTKFRRLDGRPIRQPRSL